MLTFKHHGMMVVVDADRNSVEYGDLVDKYGEDNLHHRHYMVKKYYVKQGNGKPKLQDVPFKSIYSMKGVDMKMPLNRHDRRSRISEQTKNGGVGYTKRTLERRRKDRR